jgi:hypothetical protein
VIASRQVAWEPVHRLLAPLLGTPVPAPGTPAWVDLDDNDPDKWSAIFWSSMWWALAEDGRQTAMAEASRAISAAADWPAEARWIQRRRSSVYIPREVA